MRFSRKELVDMIEEEAERTTRLAEVELQNVKEPLSLEEIDMLDLLLTRADLYGTVPDGHSPDVFGMALDAANDLYKETKKQFDKEQPPANAPQNQTEQGQQGSDWNNQRWEKSGANWDNE